MNHFFDKNPYLLGLCVIPVGILRGMTANKRLGIGITILAAIFTIICLQQKKKQTAIREANIKGSAV